MINSYNTKRWYIFYTYPRFEEKVHEFLLKEKFESFLPLCWVVRQWSDRKKRMKVPLFPSYVFVNIERDRIPEVLKTPKVVRCVSFSKIPAYLKEKEFDSIKQIIENDYPFEVSSNLKVGNSVVITKGALTGLEGVLVEERGSQRFALIVESLQQSLLVNIPSCCIELSEVLV